MENSKLPPVEDRYTQLMTAVGDLMESYGASLVLKREPDEHGNDAANLYVEFDSDPGKPQFVMRAVKGLVSIRRVIFPSALPPSKS